MKVAARICLTDVDLYTISRKGVIMADFDNMMDAEVEMLFKKQQAELQELRNDDRLQGMPGPQYYLQDFKY